LLCYNLRLNPHKSSRSGERGNGSCNRKVVGPAASIRISWRTVKRTLR